MNDLMKELASSLGGAPCTCSGKAFKGDLIVITGGPGSGKTAVTKLAQKHFCQHIAFVPEAASIVFGGGFWRLKSPEGRKAGQRTIFHVQREMETLITQASPLTAAICDRGTIDGLAYWPEAEESYWRENKTTKGQEMARYKAVIHLRTPQVNGGYDHSNPLRTEDAQLAAEIDEKLLEIWRDHPRRIIIDSSENFLQKALSAIKEIQTLTLI